MGETDSLLDELSVHAIEVERKVVVKNVDDYEEVDNVVNIRYLNQQRQKIIRYQPTLQGNGTKMIMGPCYSTVDKNLDPLGPKKMKFNRY